MNDKTKYTAEFLAARTIAYKAGYMPIRNGYLIIDETDHLERSEYVEIKYTGKGWAIIDLSFRWSKSEQDFIYTPSASNRTDEFYNDTLFQTAVEAFAAFDNWREKVIQAELKKGTPRWSEILKKYKESSGT